jgi:quercetin dioxygenase-like cupin family protein
MEIKKQDETINRPEGERALDAPFLTIDLPEYVEQIRNEKMWQERDHNAITVFKDDQLTVVLVAMHPTAEIKTLRPQHLWTAQVLEGSVRLMLNDKDKTLQKGQMVAVHAGMPYTLQALDETLILLTVAGEESEKI